MSFEARDDAVEMVSGDDAYRLPLPQEDPRSPFYGWSEEQIARWESRKKRRTQRAFYGYEPNAPMHLQRMAWEIPAEQLSQFLAVLGECGVITRAAQEAGLSAGLVNVRRQVDEDFALMVESARDFARDSLVSEAHRRAVDGQERPVIAQGKVVGTFSETSDRLLEFLIRRADDHSEKRKDARERWEAQYGQNAKTHQPKLVDPSEYRRELLRMAQDESE